MFDFGQDILVHDWLLALQVHMHDSPSVAPPLPPPRGCDYSANPIASFLSLFSLSLSLSLSLCLSV